MSVLQGVIRTTVAIMFASLAGCLATQPAPSYMQLTTNNATLGQGAFPAVVVEAVRMPDFLLRPELLRRQDATNISYDARYRWAEPLDIGIQRVIALQLSNQLDSALISAAPALPPGGKADWRVKLVVQHFELEQEQLLLRANVRISSDNSNAALALSLDHENRGPVPVTDGNQGSAIAAALSAMLTELSAEIANAVRSADAGDDLTPREKVIHTKTEENS